MKLWICFALLFVLASAQIEIGIDEDEEDGAFPPPDGYYDEEDGDMIDVGTTGEDGDEDDDDYPTEEPTSTPGPKLQCMKKFLTCKVQVSPFDCAGKLKCYEEKSQCYQAYKAKQPYMTTKSPDKMVCKNTFDSCLANSDDTCMSKLRCYIGKQLCYMKMKAFGRRRRPHGRRHHRRHRRPCPKMMKCKMEYKNCTVQASTCEEKLDCMLRKHECYERARPTMPTTGYGRRRHWNPKRKEKCKNELKKCRNESSSCIEKMKCFWEMKSCMMGHRPRPHGPMMKCKEKYISCTVNATNCDEKIACMWRKHECYKQARPSMPPPVQGDRGYRRRPQWNPEHKAKCEQEVRKCIKESDSCAQKLTCFWEMKKCMMAHRRGHHMMRMKLQQIKSKIHGIISNLAHRARPWFQRKRHGFKHRMDRMKERTRKWGSHMKKRFQGWGKHWGGRRQQWRKNWNNKVVQPVKKRINQWRQRKPWLG